MSHTLIPLILAGGKGERFWPLSRINRPKQFLSLDGTDQTLLQATANRLLALADGWERLGVITASHLAERVREQLPELPAENLLVEPEGRDTAPAVAWGTLEVARRFGEDAVVGFFPADHWIQDQNSYQQTIRAAATLARTQPAIVTLGITPTHPSTGYGYIEQGELTGTYEGLGAYRVTRFTEKPDRTTAETFISSGRFSWNSGMFVFQAGVAIAELQTHAPEILEPIQSQGVAAYAHLPKRSIDYALMEKTQKAYVLPAAFGWDDLGDWNAIERLLKQEQPNVELGNHIGLGTQDAIFYASNPEEVIVTIGLKDVVVVRDGHVTLIVNKDQTQDIKKAVELIRNHDQFKHLL